MSVIEIAGAAVVAAGAYLHWAVQPVLAAYRVGWYMGQRSASK